MAQVDVSQDRMKPWGLALRRAAFAGRSVIVTAVGVVAAAAAPATPADPFADPSPGPYAVSGSGFVTDDSHPAHPGDFREVAVDFALQVDPATGEAALELAYGEVGDDRSVDRYFVRRGRIFQTDAEGIEIPAEPFGDLAPATLAAIHPALVASAVRERRENLRPAGPAGDWWFAWNDEQCNVSVEGTPPRIAALSRRTFHERFGDGTEESRWDAGADGGSPLAPARVVVRNAERELARFDFAPAATIERVTIPVGDPRRDRVRVITASEVAWTELAPHVFALDIAALNTRVTVAEFSDHVFVIEGAYSSRNVDLLARLVAKRLGKPVRYFAFSHLHGQYIGGTRSWVEQGATIVVPPSTAPLVERLVASPHTLRPDALSEDPKPLHLETVAEHRVFADGTNELEVFNVASDHTDEYFLFHFPRQKILLTGDLLFYRPGQPLKGRSRKLCDTVRALGLDPDRFVATWPLEGYGTKNVVTRDEMRAGCEAAAATE